MGASYTDALEGTMTATATATASTTSCVIRAQDFNPNTADRNRSTWQVGTMRHVIDALAGTPVAITTDRLTGHTQVGVRLVRAYYSDGPRILIDYTLSTGEVQRTRYDLRNIGDTIVPLARTSTKDAKWTALDTHREESMAAIRWAKANHGEGREDGQWSADPGSGEVRVRWTPTARPGDATPHHQRPARWYGTVAVRDLTPFVRQPA
ncbi:hypothetical protein JNW90_24200 [Micromonospora sp. STR1s_5]|nr:hypothetical protein [Micromonospora sp. STR1s_5]